MCAGHEISSSEPARREPHKQGLCQPGFPSWGRPRVKKKKKKKDLMGACRRKGFLTTDRKAKKRKSVVGQGKGEKQREAMERRPEEPGPEQVLGAEQGRCQG